MGEVIKLPQRHRERYQILCAECGSRAMRFVCDKETDTEFRVECHNCGDVMLGLKGALIDD